MINKGCMLPRAAGMLQGEVTLFVPAKDVATLLIQKKFLKGKTGFTFQFLHHPEHDLITTIQMEITFAPLSSYSGDHFCT